jgi:hypothetical protein
MDAWMASDDYNRFESIRLFLRLSSSKENVGSLPPVGVWITTTRVKDDKVIGIVVLDSLRWEEGKDLFERQDEEKTPQADASKVTMWGVIVPDILNRTSQDDPNGTLEFGEYYLDIRVLIDDHTDLVMDRIKLRITKHRELNK